MISISTIANSLDFHFNYSNAVSENIKFGIFKKLQVLEELLTKLDIDHVTWNSDKHGYYYTIIFPLESGEPCETTLHCLTQLGIGMKLGSSVR